MFLHIGNSSKKFCCRFSSSKQLVQSQLELNQRNCCNPHQPLIEKSKNNSCFVWMNVYNHPFWCSLSKDLLLAASSSIHIALKLLPCCSSCSCKKKWIRTYLQSLTLSNLELIFCDFFGCLHVN